MAGAEAILVNGVTEILKRLVIVVVEEIGLAWGVKEELEKLKDMLNLILSLMADAERKQWNDAAVKLWMKELKALAYEADDIVDEFSYEIKHCGCHEKDRPNNKVRNFFLACSSSISISSSRTMKPSPMFCLKMGHKIQDINKKFTDISMLRDNLGLVYSIDSSSDTMIQIVHGRNMKRETYSYVDASKIFGRENDTSYIVDMLLDKSWSSSNEGGGEAVSVIPIVGMGGLGKTTLAQLVYNDKTIIEYFDMRMWVCVTQTFNVKRILVNITESITMSKCEDVSNLDVIVNRLQGYLRGKRFLLVLDDVWNKNQEEWDNLKTSLTVGDARSKIVMTTRSNIVASIVVGNRFPPYQLERLPVEDCWSIFTQKAFGASGGAVETPNLVAIGRELLNRCGGLPLAANFLGSLLRNKEEEEWLIIKNSEIWDEHCEDENRILPVLKLSYDHLPSHLKQCFSYCSIIPKSREIKRDNLIQLWMAEGFLPQPNGRNGKSMEGIGLVYFKYLLDNCFFQDVHDYEDTLVFKMHDLVHDLAQTVSGNQECLIVAERANNVEYISQTRRLQLVNLDEEMLAMASNRLNDAKELRSFFVKQTRGVNIETVINNNKRLRVLDLSETDLDEFPPSISNLKHLRYLDISHTNIKTLPESITKLYHLQTLKLDATKLSMLPGGLHKLSDLKNLQFNRRNA